jgi:hypothetical protein
VISTSNWPQRAIVATGSAGLLNQPNLIANNLIKLADTNSSSAFTGLFLDTTAFYMVAHNTVAIEGTNGSSTALYVANSGGNNVYNNILANMGAGKAAVYSGLGSILQSNHNNLYSAGSELADFGGSASVDLAGWQIATGLDKNSVSSNPGFASRTDLQICDAATDNSGTPIALVTSDHDGVMRDPNHPDPGALEFASPAKFSIGNQFNICNGDTFSITPSVSINDILIWNNADTGFTYQTNMSGTYTVENISQCGTGRDTFDVVINTLADLPNDTNICSGDTLTLNSNVAGSILWNDGNNNTSKMVTTAGRYSIEVIDGDGCYSADTIYVTRSLAASLPADTTICEGDVVQLDPKTGSGTYTWSNGSTDPVIFVDSSFNYSLTFTDALGCTSNAATMVSVMKKPKGGFASAQSQSNMEFVANDTLASSYHWSFGDGKSASGPYKTVHVYATNGSYKVTLTLSNMCGTVIYDSTLEIGTIGKKELDANAQFRIYPNPAKGYVYVDDKDELINSISITDLTGRIVLEQKEIQRGKTIKIDVSNISIGQYIISMTDKNGQFTSSKINITR